MENPNALSQQPPFIVANIIGHIVGVCSCPARVVTVVPLNGTVECASCKQQYRVRKLLFEYKDGVDGAVDTVEMNVIVEPIKKITAASILEMPIHGAPRNRH